MKNSKQNQQKKEDDNKEVWIAVFLVLAIVIIVAVGYFTDIFSKDSFSFLTDLTKKSEEVKEDNSKEKVAIVNGEAIFKGELDTRTQQISGQASGETQLSDDQKKQVLNRLIDEVLFYQKAKNEGLSANEDEIENQYQKAKGQFEDSEQFEKALRENNITKEAFKENLKRGLVLNQYIEQIKEEEEIEVTEEEIKNFYDQNVAGQEQAPELEQIRDQIKEELIQQKISEIVTEIIEEFKARADIEILL